MTTIDLESKSIEELWALHEEITSVLLRTMEAEKLKLEKRLYQLRAKIVHDLQHRRPYPEVHPKFRNPNPPHQTWSGRGKQPVWLRQGHVSRELPHLNLSASSQGRADQMHKIPAALQQFAERLAEAMRSRSEAVNRIAFYRERSLSFKV